ncbi:cob(I)yrinic acid a,c-diamide adenosyltransferase [Pseudomonadales bacterium]|nr:cob(I)yrinic acid a,c-diamide adenosyltransferase [Pseudomonadales bacterium]
MSRISRVTTNNGDGGQTRLATGKKIAKTAPMIRTLGSTDELNSAIGLLRCHLTEVDHADQIQTTLGEVQQALFDLGAVLALEGQYDAKTLVTGQDSITQAVEQMNTELPPLTEFVIPGGTIAAAHSHVCRTVCRRAETDLWSALEATQEQPEATENLRAAGVYLNRLSDYFFVLARTLMTNTEEPQWRGPQKNPK